MTGWLRRAAARVRRWRQASRERGRVMDMGYGHSPASYRNTGLLKPPHDDRNKEGNP